MEHEQPRVVAVVVAYDSARWLPACLEALDRQGIPTIVVDNASRDGTAAVARDAGARVITNAKNEGYGRGNNQGIRAAEGADWCMIVNPDAVLDTDCVRLLLDGARRHSRAAILVPKLVEPDGRSFDHSTSVLSQAAPIETEYVSQGERVVPFTSGACMLVQRSAFLSIGGFERAYLSVLRGRRLVLAHPAGRFHDRAERWRYRTPRTRRVDRSLARSDLPQPLASGLVALVCVQKARHRRRPHLGFDPQWIEAAGRSADLQSPPYRALCRLGRRRVGCLAQPSGHRAGAPGPERALRTRAEIACRYEEYCCAAAVEWIYRRFGRTLYGSRYCCVPRSVLR